MVEWRQGRKGRFAIVSVQSSPRLPGDKRAKWFKTYQDLLSRPIAIPLPVSWAESTMGVWLAGSIDDRRLGTFTPKSIVSLPVPGDRLSRPFSIGLLRICLFGEEANEGCFPNMIGANA